jgi:pantoate--beta-alanine ligase
MEIVNRTARMSAITAKLRATDVTVGLVPTMGAIHPGHISLIQTARKMSDVVVVSIFVNRLQFLSDEEFKTYPRDITKDVDALKDIDVVYVFAPLNEEMYPPNFSTIVEVESTDWLPETYREAFFRGMTTNVMKLLHIVRPRFLFLGQKDAVQGAILRKMIADLNMDTEVVITPVVRDPSGLAYAARNCFLNESQTRAAAVIYRSLRAAEEAFADGELQAKKLIRAISSLVESEPLARLQYAAVVDPETLEPLSKVERSALLAVGATIGNTPLNDSVLIDRAAKPDRTDG